MSIQRWFARSRDLDFGNGPTKMIAVLKDDFAREQRVGCVRDTKVGSIEDEDMGRIVDVSADSRPASPGSGQQPTSLLDSRKRHCLKLQGAEGSCRIPERDADLDKVGVSSRGVSESQSHECSRLLARRFSQVAKLSEDGSVARNTSDFQQLGTYNDDTSCLPDTPQSMAWPLPAPVGPPFSGVEGNATMRRSDEAYVRNREQALEELGKTLARAKEPGDMEYRVQNEPDISVQALARSESASHGARSLNEHCELDVKVGREVDLPESGRQGAPSWMQGHCVIPSISRIRDAPGVYHEGGAAHVFSCPSAYNYRVHRADDPVGLRVLGADEEAEVQAAAPTVLPLLAVQESSPGDPTPSGHLLPEGKSSNWASQARSEHNRPPPSIQLAQGLEMAAQAQTPHLHGADTCPVEPACTSTDPQQRHVPDLLSAPMPGCVSSASCTPGTSTQAKMLEAYVPRAVADALRRRDGGNLGDAELYDWQRDALLREGVLAGRNFVYCAPTSGGKSLVAEILTLKRVYETQKPALIVLPFVTLCAEKAAHWEKLVEPLGWKVARNYATHSKQAAKLAGLVGVVVCTIEKANMLVNAMAEEGTLATGLCAVVVDELHMVTDEHRGFLNEVLLTKLRYACKPVHPLDSTSSGSNDRDKEDAGKGGPGPGLLTQVLGSAASGASQPVGVQLIGMSATLPNLSLIARWLDATMYETTFRPVQLKVWIFVPAARQIRTPSEFNAGSQVRWEVSDVLLDEWPVSRDTSDLLGFMAHQTVKERKSVLIFCGTKNRVEQAAKGLADMVAAGVFTVPERCSGQSFEAPQSGQTQSKREQLMAELPKDIPPELRKCLSEGVAYHHAGLAMEVRELCEDAFRSGAISILVATQTLAAGVNLPAQRVIIRDAWIASDKFLLEHATFRQMVGRAGRAGIDKRGEAVVIQAQTNARVVHHVENLLTEPAAPVTSCLAANKNGMDRIMLEVVASGLVSRPEHMLRFITCTLLSAEHAPSVTSLEEWKEEVSSVCSQSISKLKDAGFVYWVPDKGAKGASLGSNKPTPLAQASVAAGLSIREALLVSEDVMEFAQGAYLENDLHFMYLIAPAREDRIVSWRRIDLVLQSASRRPAVRAVVALASIDLAAARRKADAGAEAFVPQEPVYKQGVRVGSPDTLRKAYKLFVALMLEALVNEEPPEAVVARFHGKPVPAARSHLKALHDLQDAAARSAMQIAAFAERVGQPIVDLLVSRFHGRVLHGIRDELVPLTTIGGVRGFTARLLFAAGFRSVEDVARSSPDDVRAALVCGKSESRRGGEWRQARKVVASAQRMLREENEQAADRVKEIQRVLSERAARNASPDVAVPSLQAQREAALHEHTRTLDASATQGHGELAVPPLGAPAGSADLGISGLQAGTGQPDRAPIRPSAASTPPCANAGKPPVHSSCIDANLEALQCLDPAPGTDALNATGRSAPLPLAGVHLPALSRCSGQDQVLGKAAGRAACGQSGNGAVACEAHLAASTRGTPQRSNAPLTGPEAQGHLKPASRPAVGQPEGWEARNRLKGHQHHSSQGGEAFLSAGPVPQPPQPPQQPPEALGPGSLRVGCGESRSRRDSCPAGEVAAGYAAHLGALSSGKRAGLNSSDMPAAKRSNRAPVGCGDWGPPAGNPNTAAAALGVCSHPPPHARAPEAPGARCGMAAQAGLATACIAATSATAPAQAHCAPAGKHALELQHGDRGPGPAPA